MDAQSLKKALFRAKMKEHDQKKSKCINSPLVRYNDVDQPVCRVCDVTLKSESSWQAHQVSRKHHEAINSLKEKARIKDGVAGQTQIKNAKSENRSEITKQEVCHSMHSDGTEPVKSLEISKPSRSSNLPENFFDHNHTKRQKTEIDEPELVDSSAPYSQDYLISHIEGQEECCREVTFPEKSILSFENGEGNNGLPEGFFDNKDADLRARGIEPVKPDIKDEYKEYEKLIQHDLQEVDDRLEEEEYDAADVIEEEEFVEQRAYKEKVEALRRRRLEGKVEVAAGISGGESNGKCGGDVSAEESSGDDDSDFAVDWRAKHV